MGRHRSSLKNALDIKSKLFFLSRLITLDQLLLRRLASFYPEIRIPAESKVSILHRSSYSYPWNEPRYQEARNFVATSNVDSPTNSNWLDSHSTERCVAIIRDVVVPGHSVIPADPATASQINLDINSISNWSRARPSISAINTRQLSDDLTLVIPKLNHFGHLLTDFLMPLFFALQMVGTSEGKAVNIITSHKPNFLIMAFIDAVRKAGLEVTHIEARVQEEIHIPRLLHASTHTRNLELKFATPEAISFARDLMLKALGRPEKTFARRIFLLRGDTRTRQVEGEAELAKKLEGIGFETLIGKWSNLAEQIFAFQNADIIVGAHGAGLANILWSKPDSTLIELFANDARKTTGLHWASAAGAHYVPLAGSDEGALQCFSIDPVRMFSAIEAIADDLNRGRQK